MAEYDETREFTMEAIIANDKRRQDLIDKVFGGPGSDKGAIKAPAATPQNISEDIRIQNLRDKHLKVRNDVMKMMIDNGYMESDQNVQACVAAFMSNVARLRY